MAMISKTKNFISEVMGELKKVAWPTKQETIKYSIAVIGVSIALAAFFGGLDFGLAHILNTYILK